MGNKATTTHISFLHSHATYDVLLRDEVFVFSQNILPTSSRNVDISIKEVEKFGRKLAINNH